MRLASKHHDAVWEYTAEFTPWLAAGEQVDAATVTVVRGDVVISTSPAPAIAAGVVTFWTSGGTAWTDCLLEVLGTTNQGRVLPIDLQLFIT